MLARLAAAGGLSILLAASLSGQDGRDKLIGTWQVSDAKSDAEVWSLETKGEVLRISHSVKDKTDQIECNVIGRDCEVKLGGRKATVAMWFNGDMLVEMETRGNEVTKRRFKVAGNDTLQLDVMAINPPGKTETVEFKRAQKAETRSAAR